VSVEKLNTKLRKLRQEMILEASERLLASDGCEKFTASKLAQMVGVGKGTIYNHLPPEGSWVEAAVSARSHALIQLSRQRSTSDHWRDQLVCLLNLTVRAAETELTDHLGPPCCLSHAPCPHIGWVPIETLIAALIRKGKEAGELPQDCDPEWLAELLQFMIVGGVTGNINSAAERKKRLHFLAHFYLEQIVCGPNQEREVR